MKTKYTCPICKREFQEEKQLLKHNKCFFDKKQRLPILKGYLIEKNK